jgi:hypothetical protein
MPTKRKPITPAEARRRLRRALQRLPPERFDYHIANERCGCVIPVWDRLLDRWGIDCHVFRQVAGITKDEYFYLIGEQVTWLGRGASYRYMTAAEATGRAGLAEALRRLAIVDARATAREREGRA